MAIITSRNSVQVPTVSATTSINNAANQPVPQQPTPPTQPTQQQETAQQGAPVGQQSWITSKNKHVFVIREEDKKSGEVKTIGYCRTKAEADNLIYDHGKKVYDERKEHREKKRNTHKVSYCFSQGLGEEETRFVIREKSLGYIYNGPTTERIIITYEKLYRTFNSQFSLGELESKVIKSDANLSGEQ